jgi:hypothetical protein
MTTNPKIPDAPSRRAMIGALAALPIASVPAVAGIAGASPLRGLIDAHRVAYDAFIEAINRLDEAENAATNSRRHEASDAEDDALTAIWGYSCETPEDARIKVEYLLSKPDFVDEAQPHHVDALLQSFLPQTNDEAEQS